jgi:hypothetical protein
LFADTLKKEGGNLCRMTKKAGKRVPMGGLAEQKERGTPVTMLWIIFDAM